MPVHDAIACVKGDVPEDDDGPVIELAHRDAPVIRRLLDGIHVAYLIDEGDRFSYIQEKDLTAAGLDADELLRLAVENLAKLTAARKRFQEPLIVSDCAGCS